MMTRPHSGPSHPPATTFEVVAELDAPREPDLRDVERQMDVLGPLATTFLAPDCHAGRPTVSSLVVAAEVQRLGGRAIACCNARDRNLLGLQRDLLTARVLGIDEVLLVAGDDTEGAPRAGLTVRRMLEECRAVGLRAGVTARPGALASWKAGADRVYLQVSWSLDEVLRWRDRTGFTGPVLAGVMVLPDAQVARRIGARIPQLRAPDALLDALDRDRDAGVHAAADLVHALRDCGAVDGVHLIAGRRSRAFVERFRTSGPRPADPSTPTEETSR